MRLASVLLLAFTSIAAAQGKAGGDVQVRFLAERKPDGLGQVVMTAADVKSAAFDLPVNHLSEPLSAPGRVFSVKPSGKDVSLANVTLPDNGKSFVVMLVPAPTGGYKPVVISAQDPSFRPGHMYFYNHGDKPVLGYVGTATFILQPGQGRTLEPKGAKDGAYNIGFGVREKEGDRSLSQSRRPVDENLRSYVFFFVNPTTKRIDFRAVEEFVEPDKKP